MKMLTVFEKGPRLRHIGHLDLMRAFQRALRRSGLPIKYSQGFNPHVILGFAAPLSLGHAALREVAEVPLTAALPEEKYRLMLNAALPEDIRIISARAVEDEHKSPMALLAAARYRVDFPEGGAPGSAQIADFLRKDEIRILKKTKTKEAEVDIKPMIHELNESGGQLFMTLSLTEKASCKAEQLLGALYENMGSPCPRVMVTRLCLFGEENGGLVPLEAL